MDTPSTSEPKEQTAGPSSDDEVLIIDMDESDVRLSPSKGRWGAGSTDKVISCGSRVVGEPKLI